MRRCTAALTVAFAVTAGACSADSDAAVTNTGPSMADCASHTLNVTAFVTVADLTTYADQLVVATAVDEAEVGRAVNGTGTDAEGSVGRDVTWRIDQTLWRRPDSRDLPGTFTEGDGDGWRVNDGVQTPTRHSPIRPEVGRTYVLAIADFATTYDAPPVAGIYNPIAEWDLVAGRMLTPCDKPGPAAFNGKTVTEAAALLDATPIHPGAEQFMHLPLLARFLAVSELGR